LERERSNCGGLLVVRREDLPQNYLHSGLLSCQKEHQLPTNTCILTCSLS